VRLYVTPAGRWTGTQAEAKELGRDDGGWQQRDVPTDKEGLLDFLNRHGVGEQDDIARSTNGFPPRQAEPAPPAASNYTEQAIRFEDAFAAMPLALKLHFAALAMEEARDKIGAPA
jgi:hypothetical protein